jgi:DNA polymerase III delta prime subunit
MARNWGNLSDYEFEQFIGDLLGVDLGMRFERFTRGKDGGIDLRHVPPGRKKPHVVQAKHYQGSTYSDLRTAARKEADRLRALGLSTASYRLVTSLGLTPANKRELASVLQPWVKQDDRIIGRDDLEALLDEHPEVERRHVKLWLGSSTQLASFLQAGTHTRSRVLAQDIKRTLPLYVQGESFGEGLERLQDTHVLLISGPPGIGKTTLARMLVGTSIAAGFEPIEVSRDIDEAWDTWDHEVPQVFLYDDFLGRTMLGALSKNEDSRLLSFLREIAASPRSRLVLTTREYILQEAARTFEAFRRYGLANTRFLLTLPSYTPIERARILHNHVWHSQLPMSAKEELVADRGYARIIGHKNFNPRLIEYVTGLQRGHPVSVARGQRWIDFAVNALGHPDEIWRQAFERELGEDERLLLMCLVTMPDEAEVGDLERAVASWSQIAARPSSTSKFESAMKVLDDSFTSARRREGDVLFCRVSNPGLADFLNRQLGRDPQLVAIAARSALYFEQLERLWQLIDYGTRTAVETVSASTDLAEAVRRLFELPGTRWIHTAGGFGGDRYERSDQTVDERLTWLLRVAQSRDLPTGLQETARDLLIARVEQWRLGRGDSSAAADLARALSEDGRLPAPDDWPDALVGMALDSASTINDWESVAALIELLPAQFPEEVREAAVDSFVLFARYELESYGDHAGSEDEIYALESIAGALDTELDEQELEFARERMRERSLRDDAMDDEDRYSWRGHDIGHLNDADEMDALFSRLTE